MRVDKESEDVARQNRGRGRVKINNPGRLRSFSQRAAKGKLEVEEGFCPVCRHKKILVTENIKKCARCKTYIGGM